MCHIVSIDLHTLVISTFVSEIGKNICCSMIAILAGRNEDKEIFLP